MAENIYRSFFHQNQEAFGGMHKNISDRFSNKLGQISNKVVNQLVKNIYY